MTRNMGSECSPFVCNLYIMKYPQKLLLRYQGDMN